MNIELIGGKWLLNVNGKLENYNSLPANYKKIFMVLFNIELIFKKHNLKY
jgi:hypothetical protein